ncbi:hypothetical protein GQ53DRAFT_653959 [Thozetella sp. PMI_491]|nr:hypothetical protein GQ53DRAFT_653959 [Thozetella sp. PMI_491]
MFINPAFVPAAPVRVLGNTPAVDVTRHLPQGLDSDILLLGCDDVRHILFTAFDATTARNALFLTFLLEESDAPTADTLWNIYYHLYLDAVATAALQNQLGRLLEASYSLDKWKQSKYGDSVRFCDAATFRAVRDVWRQFGEDFGAKDSDTCRGRLKSAIGSSKQRRDLTHGDDSIDYSAVRATSPLAAKAVKGEELEAAKGTVGQVSSGTSIPNSLFAWAPPGRPIITRGREPFISFHLASAYASVAATSPLQLLDGPSGAGVSKVVQTAQLQFREWVGAFRDLKTSIKVRFAAADSFALCHTFRQLQETGALSAHWYRRTLSLDPLELDQAEYGQGGSAPRQFDAIDTSDLSSSSGALSVLISAGPLLKDLAWATLSTEIAENSVKPGQHAFDVLLCGHTKALSVLLGLAPVEYWTNATTVSTVDEMLLAKSINSVSGRQKRPSIQARISWKAARHLSGAVTAELLTVDAAALSTLAFKIYQDMFQSESASFLSGLTLAQNTKDLGRAAGHLKYHRSTFVAFLKALVKSVDTDVAAVCRSVIQKVSNDKDSIFASNTLQAMCLEMSAQGLHSEEWLTSNIRRSNSAAGFSSWKDIPEAVSVTLCVPAANWKAVSQASVDRGLALALQGCLRAVAEGIPLWNNNFADLHVVFGTIISTGRRGDDGFNIAVKEDKEGWAGTSPMVVSFYVPTAALQADIPKTLVSLALQHSVQSAFAFAKDLGSSLVIFETPLVDEQHVFITKQPPNLAGYRIACGSSLPSKRSSEPTAKGPKFKVDLAESGSISSLTGHLDITSEQGKRLLQEKVPVELRQGGHPCVIEIVFGKPRKPDLVLPLCFPVPVRKDQSKTRIARTSAYIEIIAPLADPTDPSLHDFVIPSTLEQTMPATLNATHLHLGSLPILDIEDKTGARFITTLCSFMYSARERELRDEVGGSGVSRDSARLNFKESLFTMFMLASGLQGGQTGLFALSRGGSDGIHMLVFVSAVRLDGANGSVVLDAAILPFTKELVESKQLEDFLLILRTLECCSLTVDASEMVLWKKALPALVERCRTWDHTAGCEYRKVGAGIPLSLDLGAQFLCSCGKGKLPDDFTNLPEWEAAAQECTRIAISPVYACQFAEELLDPEKLMQAAGVDATDMCRTCGATKGRNGGELKKCARCLVVKYCSTECQRKDWRKHRMECEEAPEHGGN